MLLLVFITLCTCSGSPKRSVIVRVPIESFSSLQQGPVINSDSEPVPYSKRKTIKPVLLHNEPPTSSKDTSGTKIVIDGVTVFKITADGYGIKHHEAIDDALRTAVGKIVEIVLVSKSKVVNNILVEDDIVVYQSAWVHSYDEIGKPSVKIFSNDEKLIKVSIEALVRVDPIFELLLEKQNPTEYKKKLS